MFIQIEAYIRLVAWLIFYNTQSKSVLIQLAYYISLSPLFLLDILALFSWHNLLSRVMRYLDARQCTSFLLSILCRSTHYSMPLSIIFRSTEQPMERRVRGSQPMNQVGRDAASLHA